MKVRVCVLIALVFLVVLSVGYNNGWAKSEVKSANDVKIGILSVREIFEKSKRNDQYKDKAKAEQDNIIAELDKLKAELDADRAGLATLKAGSNDYQKLVKQVIMKQSNAEAQQRYYEQELAMKDQRWTEEFYKNILEATKEVARSRGLSMVLEYDQIDLPAPSANELMLTIRTHKVLYSEGCLDITDDVLAKIDGNAK